MLGVYASRDLGRGRLGKLPPHPALRGHLPPKGEGLESIKKPATGYGSGRENRVRLRLGVRG